jgi:hypothetical protein
VECSSTLRRSRETVQVCDLSERSEFEANWANPACARFWLIKKITWARISAFTRRSIAGGEAGLGVGVGEGFGFAVVGLGVGFTGEELVLRGEESSLRLGRTAEGLTEGLGLVVAFGVGFAEGSASCDGSGASVALMLYPEVGFGSTLSEFFLLAAGTTAMRTEPPTIATTPRSATTLGKTGACRRIR